MNKDKASSICPPFPSWTVPLGNQLVDERKYLFMEVFQLTNENEMTEHYHFATPSELMDPGIEHQQLLTSQKGRYADILCLLVKNTPPATINNLAKGIKLKSNQAVGSNYQFAGNTELRVMY